MKLIGIPLALMTISLFIVTYISMWDYPNIAIVSSIWGIGAMLCTIYLFAKESKTEKGESK